MIFRSGALDLAPPRKSGGPVDRAGSGGDVERDHLGDRAVRLTEIHGEIAAAVGIHDQQIPRVRADQRGGRAARLRTVAVVDGNLP